MFITVGVVVPPVILLLLLIGVGIGYIYYRKHWFPIKINENNSVEEGQ